MKKHHKNQFQPWGSNVVADIDVFCRSKIPFIPELSISFAGHPLTDFEYDFVHERQVIADHDQYFDLKSRLERTDLTSPGTASSKISPVPSSDLAVIPETTVRSHSPSRVSDAATVSYAPPIHSQLFYRSPNPPIAPPIAARQLVVGQILQPSKTDSCMPPESAVSNYAHQACSTTTTTTTTMTPSPHVSANTAERRPSFVRDFESGADDPFISAELKTINEMEELSNVLSSTAVARSNVPSTVVGSNAMSSKGQLQSIPNGPSNIQPCVYLHAGVSPPPLRITEPSFKSSSTQAYAVPNYGMPHNHLGYLPPGARDHLVVGPHFSRPLPSHTERPIHSWYPGEVSPKSLSSSVPNLESTVNVERPHSVTTTSDVHKIYRPIPFKPTIAYGNRIQLVDMNQPVSEFANAMGQPSLGTGGGRVCRTPNSSLPVTGTARPMCPNRSFPRFPSHQNSGFGS